MDIAGYLDEVRKAFGSGHATEHSYRKPLQSLFESIDPSLTIINEAKQSEGGMPDFLFLRGQIPFGWVEAKDIDKDVIKLKGYSKEQRKRYEAAYPNLIYTNGVDFEFIREGESVHFVSIADFLMGLQPNAERFGELERQLKLFAEQKPISIRSAAKLADMMAAKAAIIKDELEIALREDREFRSDLGIQFKSFKANLLPHLTPDEFADLYAETITYGMFAARFHDTDLNTFSRQEAMEDLPASNPFLKGLFRYIAGDLPKRLEYVVDDLVQVMRASDPHSLFEDFGKFTARNDPFIHFYENFLAAYNPKKRKSRGVYYTPEPVVDFIVRAVDDVLKTEFGLADGLADTSKAVVDWDTGQSTKGKPVTIKKEVHKVQILDPATGTGTFLAKAVQLVSDRVKATAPGKWSNYVEQDLLPRLHGFELLMASYAMCHMKLDMMLDQTGYMPSAKPPRLSVWLTNALEPADRDIADLFMPALVQEAQGAAKVKRQTPIMCVIGNPPYSISSSNRGEWIESLNRDYKLGLEDETNISPLSDDYIKFIRMAHHFVMKNGMGIIGFISNNTFLHGIIHRTMRANILRDFDKIWIVNLHGNSNIGEVAPDGSPDTNVFDIRQGVALYVLARTPAFVAEHPQRIVYDDVWGSRAGKYEWLFASDVYSLSKSMEPRGDRFYFVPRSNEGAELYRSFISLKQLCPTAGIGTKFRKDNLLVRPHFSPQSVREMVQDVMSLEATELTTKYRFSETKDWAHSEQRQNFSAPGRTDIQPVDYRPFDTRYTYYPLDRITRIIPRGDARLSVMRHLIERRNVGLCINRQIEGPRPFTDVFVCEHIFDLHGLSMKESNQVSPLYLHGELGSRINFDPKLYAGMCEAAAIDPADQAEPDDNFRAATGEARPSEVKVFDYIYGVLHSPEYRETFAEFLKIDFPRIPYPPSPEVFCHVSEKGEQLRRLHLMEAGAIGDTPYTYEGEGDDVVTSGYPKWESGKVYVNKDQYFDDVPKLAWEFYIGGYQPAQKWLKDRRGRTLSYEDITHYQRIIKILSETDRIMKEIELPLD